MAAGVEETMHPPADAVRCFIAIHLPADVLGELSALEEGLKAGGHPFVKWVEPGNLHLTLKFLGNAPAASIPGIAEAMRRAAGAHAPFRLQLDGTGAFPGWQRPQVVWVGLAGDLDRLQALKRDLEAAVSPLGFPEEPRPWSAHLTLGRVRNRTGTADRRRFARFAQGVGGGAGPWFQVGSVSLVRSRLTPDGPVYTDLAVAPLELPAGRSAAKG